MLKRSKIERCSLIRGATGSTRCTTSENCHNIKCDKDKVVRCQQAGKQCRLLTNCAARKQNCFRALNNRTLTSWLFCKQFQNCLTFFSEMKNIAMARCKGFKLSDGFKPCRPLGRKKKRSGIEKLFRGWTSEVSSAEYSCVIWRLKKNILCYCIYIYNI